MRQELVVLGLAGALAASAALSQGSAAAAAPQAAPAPAAAKAPAAAPGPGWERINMTDPVLAYYPPAARAAGVEGQAVIRCKRDEHLALVGCTLVSETPAGQGFGAAALAMAAKSPPNPKLELKDAAAEPASDATVQFTLQQPYITPDLTRMAHLMKGAQIVAQPSAAQIQAEYPPRALDNQVQGRAIIECAVGVAGKLADCHVFDEQPNGYGFGQAALNLAGAFTMKPRLIDGEPAAGPVRIAVAFTGNDPDAPLTLQTRPAGAPPQDDGGFHAGGLPPISPPPPRSMGGRP